MRASQAYGGVLHPDGGAADAVDPGGAIRRAPRRQLRVKVSMTGRAECMAKDKRGLTSKAQEVRDKIPLLGGINALCASAMYAHRDKATRLDIKA